MVIGSRSPIASHAGLLLDRLARGSSIGFEEQVLESVRFRRSNGGMMAFGRDAGGRDEVEPLLRDAGADEQLLRRGCGLRGRR
jgi:hypothetical protein